MTRSTLCIAAIALTMSAGVSLSYASSPQNIKTCDALPIYTADLQSQLAQWDPAVIRDIKRVSFIGEYVTGRENAFYNSRTGDLGIIVPLDLPQDQRREKVQLAHHELGHQVYAALSDFFLDSFLAAPQQDPQTITTTLGYGIRQWNGLQERLITNYAPASCAREFVQLAYIDLPDLEQKLRIIEPHNALATSLLKSQAELGLNPDDIQTLQGYQASYAIVVPKVKSDIQTAIEFVKEQYGSSYSCMKQYPLRELLLDKGVSDALEVLVAKTKNVRHVFDETIEDPTISEMYRVSATTISIELDILELGRTVTINSETPRTEMFARAVQSLMTLYTGEPTRGVFALEEDMLQQLEAIDYKGTFIFREPAERYRKAQKLAERGVSTAKRERRLFLKPDKTTKLPPISCVETRDEYIDLIKEKLQ